MTFKEWHKELTALARKYHVACLIPPVEDYPTDGYDDGNTPYEELGEQYSAASD